GLDNPGGAAGPSLGAFWFWERLWSRVSPRHCVTSLDEPQNPNVSLFVNRPEGRRGDRWHPSRVDASRAWKEVVNRGRVPRGEPWVPCPAPRALCRASSR